QTSSASRNRRNALSAFSAACCEWKQARLCRSPSRRYRASLRSRRACSSQRRPSAAGSGCMQNPSLGKRLADEGPPLHLLPLLGCVHEEVEAHARGDLAVQLVESLDERQVAFHDRDHVEIALPPDPTAGKGAEDE